MDLTSRKPVSQASALSAPDREAAPSFSPQGDGQARTALLPEAKDAAELPSMPGMPGESVNKFFAAMLDKGQDADTQDAASLAQALRPAGMRPLEGDAAKEEKNGRSGAWKFLRDLVMGGEHEQKPDEGFLKSLEKALGKGGGQPGPGGGPPQANAGLFAAMDAPLHGLTPDDIQFASEVDAALARRPRFGVRALSLTVAGMFLALIIWGAFADIDEVTHAEGQVVGSQRTQTIQNLEGGILRGLLVREGQIVEKGVALAQLDNEMAESSYRDAMSKAMENSLAIMRLESELKNQQPVYPKDLRAWAAQITGQPVNEAIVERARQIVRDQDNAWRSRQERLNSELDVLRAQHAQRQHDLEEQMARKNQLDRSLALSIEQRDTAHALLLRNNFSRMEYLGMQQRVVELQGQIDMLAASIPKAKAAADEFMQRIASRRAEQNTAITDEINKRRLELNSLRETLSAGSDRVTRTELRTPVRGTVKQIYINTVGGVVKPGEPIMDIVPLDDTLLVESRVMPKDVAFLSPGQHVMVKISAYDFSIYGGLEGKLESISADTIEDKRGNYYYLVKVRTQKTSIVYHNEILPIIPGMMVTTDIMIGKKTVLDYLLKPILKAKQNALRER
ncbi:MAG: HlyD family type I secretion periplasmic adaptor subunit [Desulfovibrio sp.]|jgi:adhesin transport system membrane fusion protein|nr:HlyD family type I secretion periplasmic adaptor subunit [Desulfovibrio sp.]